MRFLVTGAAVVMALVAACTLMPQQAVGHSPAAIRDAYLIAHGMARGYGERPDADPKVLAQLQMLDLQAAQAVRSMVTTGNATPDDTARAVAALTDFAARQTPVSP